MITLVLLIIGWLGLNAIAAYRVSQVRRLAMLENGEDIARLPSPDSLPCCSAFEAVRYGPKLTGWYARGKPSRSGFVLVHGYATNLTATSELAGELHERGYSVLTINLGFVTGAHNYSSGTLEGQDVGHAVRWLRGRHRGPIVPWGFSAGGHASVLAAAGGTEVEAVIADGAPVSAGDEIYEAVVDRVRLPGFMMPRAVFDRFVWMFTRRMPVSLDRVPERDLRRVPTLIIQGEHDQLATPDQGRLLAKRTDAELWLMPDVGHVEGFEELGDEYVRRVLAFVDRTLRS